MAKFLSNDGLLYFWQKLKTMLADKVDRVEGKGLSTNDYTAAEKTKLAAIADGANAYVHPAHDAHAEGLYKVTVDALGHITAGTAVVKADITKLGIPGSDTTYAVATSKANGLMAAADKAKLDTFAPAAEYAKKSDITAMYRYKGTVASVAALPKTDNVVGDVYDVGEGMNYAWDGSKWDALGQTFSVDAVTNAEIDTILAS